MKHVALFSILLALSAPTIAIAQSQQAQEQQRVERRAQRLENDRQQQTVERDSLRKQRQLIRDLQRQRDQLQAQQDNRLREQAEQNASAADQRRLRELQQQRNELQAQQDRRLADEARMRQRQERQREYRQAQTDSQSRTPQTSEQNSERQQRRAETEQQASQLQVSEREAAERTALRKQRQLIRDLQRQRDQLQDQQDNRQREQAEQNERPADQRRLRELEQQRNELQAISDARAPLSVQQEQASDALDRSNQATSRQSRRNFVSSNTTIQSKRPEPVGLDQNDRRFVDALPRQLQSQLLNLSPAEIDAIKARGNWQRIKETFAQSGSAIRNADVEGQREQVAIWENAWSKFKTTLDYGSLALGVGEIAIAAKAYRAVRAEKSAILVSKAGSIRGVNSVAGKENCVGCAFATDSILAGRGQSAIDVDKTGVDYFERHYGSRFGSVSSISDIKAVILKAGSGARGIVHGLRGTQPGHVFNVVNQKGIVRFLDGQTGKTASFDGFTGFRLLRTNK